MKKLHLIGLAVLAVFAFSAIAAASAFAINTEWLWNGAQVTVKDEVLPVEIKGSLELEDAKEATRLECSGTFLGYIYEKTLDLIVLIEDLKGHINEAGKENAELECEVLVSGECLEAVGTVLLLAAINLPWETELMLEGALVVDLIFNAANNSGWLVECISKILGVKVDNACTASTWMNMENTAEGLMGEFIKAESPAANCSLGGNGQGLINGLGFVVDEEGGALTIS